jgi:hypothetical protein
MKLSRINLVYLFGALVRGCEGLWRALPSSASAKKAALCVEEDPALFTQCPVEEPRAAWGDVNLTSYKAQWDAARSSVPALTAMCKGGGWTKYPCRTFGALDWEGKPGKQLPKRVVIDTDMTNEVDDFPAVVWALLSSLGPSRQLKVESVLAAPFSFRFQFMPLHGAAELKEQVEADSEAHLNLSSEQKNYLKKYQKQLWSLEEEGTSTNQMIERENHATWCPSKGMEESYKAIVDIVALFSRAKDTIGGGISPGVEELAKTKVFHGQDRYVTWSKLSHLKASDGVADLIKRAEESTVDDPLFVVAIGAPTNVAAALLLAPQIVGKIVVVWDASWYPTRTRTRT